MIYEIREYTTVPGRMPALVKRFNEHTLGLFQKHGIDLDFISLTGFGDNTGNELVYVVRFEDYGDLERKWAAFQGDPDWQAAKAASEADGPIVANISRRILSPSAFEAAQ
ncbi:NIPSNAP family protein [Pseudonocardia eucalypti]|uniref:NIPSNAP family protein n=1 Tax=Pseudonocardia eucalypti TaxID=648755 RepID=A0ABP9Q880_9PSEU|nr:hypothetical protein [Pseudonocardia eucalypti]